MDYLHKFSKNILIAWIVKNCADNMPTEKELLFIKWLLLAKHIQTVKNKKKKAILDMKCDKLYELYNKCEG